MTTHTPAPIPKGSLLTAGQILSLPRHSNMTDDEALRFGRAIETALLSNLRAPVADPYPVRLLHERDNSLAERVDSWHQRNPRAALASAPVAGEAQPAASTEHYDEVKATLQGAHRIMESLSAIERRVGPIGSHARGYTHKITAALRHLDALYAAPQASTLATEYARGRADGFDAAKGAPHASEAVRLDADALDLARAGMELHSPGMPEHTVCAELVRLAVALSAQPGAPYSEDDGKWKPQTPQQIAAGMRSFARSEGLDWPDPDSAQPGAQKGGSDGNQ
ncbi:hypothetical protein A7J67_08500 [Achromobacter xylosoxidans]|nr:hypothetical protein A7J67_08500 [Achromobacter xylosoxidans]